MSQDESTEQKKPPKYSVPALDKAFDVLELLSEHGASMS